MCARRSSRVGGSRCSSGRGRDLSTLFGAIVGAIAGFKAADRRLLMRVTDFSSPSRPSCCCWCCATCSHNVGWLEPIFGGLQDGSHSWSCCSSALAWMVVARIVRGVVLSLREPRALSSRRPSPSVRRRKRIVARHLIPQLARPDHRLAHHGGRRGDRRRGHAVVLRLRHRSRVTRTSWGTLLDRRPRVSVITGQWWLVVFPLVRVHPDDPVHQLHGRPLRDAFDPKQSLT